MHMILLYPNGRNVDALLLSATPGLMRVVIRGRGETSEFKFIEGRWTSESGVPIEVGALLSGETTDLGRFPSCHATARISAAV
jgi:hypothetical protein